MDILQRELITELEPELQLVYSQAKGNITNCLPKEFSNSMPYVVHFLSRRYVDCITKTPQNARPTAFMDYLFEGTESYSPDTAARVCEFYGGVMSDCLNQRKCMMTVSDLEFKLGVAYDIMSKGNVNFNGLSSLTQNILQAFRNTTASIAQGNVIQLNFNRD